MPKIGICGNIIVDNIKHIARYPKSGMLENITAIEHGVGGCVSNTICDLAVIDPALELFAFGVVGADAAGAQAREMLESHGVDIGGVVTHASLATSFTDCFCDAETGERTFFHYRGSNAALDDGVDLGALALDHMHLGYLLLLDGLDAPDETYGTKAAALLARLQKSGVKTSADIVSENSDRYEKIVVPALKYTDYVIFNELEAAATCGMEIRRDGELLITEMPRLLNKLMDFGVGEMAFIHCPEAGFAIDKQGSIYAQGSYELKSGYIKGTIGAGDAFCAGALYGVNMGFGVDETLRFANAAAALNLRAADSISGMGPRAEIERFIAANNQRKLVGFDG